MAQSLPTKKQGHALLEVPRLEPELLQDEAQKVTYKPGAGFGLILGLIILQLITLGAALTVGLSSVDSPDTAAALDMPVAVQQNHALVDPLPPTATPPPPSEAQLSDGLIERLVMARTHSLAAAQPSANVAAITPQPLASVRLRGLEITQGIQVFNEPENPACNPNLDHPNFIFCNNSMPMVAGRHTLVRAFLGCNGNCPIGATTIRLRLLKDGQEQASLTRALPAETLQQVASLRLSELRLVLENSVNFEFFPPPDWFSGQITFVLEVVPADDNASPPVQVTFTKNFEIRQPLRVAYLPIAYNGLLPPDPLQADYWLLRMYPVAAVEYYRLPMPDLVWQGDVSKSEVLRKLLYSYWFYAQNNPGQAQPDQLFGWLPQELYNGGASDPFWCPDCAGLQSSRVAFGGLRPEQDIGGPRILAHEIAHNLGAQHAWSPTHQEDTACFKAEGADIWVDPDWPYQQTPFIQEVGIDLYSSPPVIYPPSYYDMMAYCAQPWISPHTYKKIFESPFLQSNSHELLAVSNFQPQVEATGNGTLLVSGLIYPDGTVSQPEIIRIEGDAFGNASAAGFAPPPLEIARQSGDDYCLDIKQGDDTLLAQRCFDTGFINLETGQSTDPSPYFFTVPGLNLEDVGKVSLSKGTVEVTSVTPSQHVPQVTVTYPTGGETITGQQTFAWDAFDADGDRLTYDLFYSINGGQSWLPLAVRLTETRYTFFSGQLLSAQKTRFRVVASDGFYSTLAESSGEFTVEPLAENSVSLVGPATVQPGQTFEVAVVANNITKPGLFGAQFELSFDPGLVQVTDLQAGSALELVLASSIQNDVGQLSLAASRQGQVDGLTGQVTLATLTLTAGAEPGQLILNLPQFLAGARGGVPLPFTSVQGLSVAIGE